VLWGHAALNLAQFPQFLPNVPLPFLIRSVILKFHQPDDYSQKRKYLLLPSFVELLLVFNYGFVLTAASVDVGDQCREQTGGVVSHLLIYRLLELFLVLLGSVWRRHHQCSHHLHPYLKAGPQRPLILLIRTHHFRQHGYYLSIQRRHHNSTVLLLPTQDTQDVEEPGDGETGRFS
jgi:hypothetical protein